MRPGMINWLDASRCPGLCVADEPGHRLATATLGISALKTASLRPSHRLFEDFVTVNLSLD